MLRLKHGWVGSVQVHGDLPPIQASNQNECASTCACAVAFPEHGQVSMHLLLDVCAPSCRGVVLPAGLRQSIATACNPPSGVATLIQLAGHRQVIFVMKHSPIRTSNEQHSFAMLCHNVAAV